MVTTSIQWTLAYPNTSLCEMFVYVKHHAENGGADTSFACSCLLNCFAACRCLVVVQTRAIQSPIEFFIRGTKCNDVIFNYIIIEMASSDNLGVRCITGVPISKGPLYRGQKKFPVHNVWEQIQCANSCFLNVTICMVVTYKQFFN